MYTGIKAIHIVWCTRWRLLLHYSTSQVVVIVNKLVAIRLISGADNGIRGLGCYAAIVVTVTRHHDVAFHSPVSTPAEGRMGIGE